MPRGHAAKREAKKPKNKDDKKFIAPPPLVAPSQVIAQHIVEIALTGGKDVF